MTWHCIAFPHCIAWQVWQYTRLSSRYAGGDGLETPTAAANATTTNNAPPSRRRRRTEADGDADGAGGADGAGAEAGGADGGGGAAPGGNRSAFDWRWVDDASMMAGGCVGHDLHDTLPFTMYSQ